MCRPGPTIAAAGVLALCLVACSETSLEVPHQGGLEGRRYSNPYFGLTLTIPEGWHPLPHDAIASAQKRGAQRVARMNEELAAVTETGGEGAIDLIVAYAHPPEGTVRSNASLRCGAENLARLSGIQSGRDYLLKLKNAMEGTQAVRASDIHSTKLGGVEFHLLLLAIRVGDLTYNQRYYAAIRKGHVLFFSTSFVTEDQRLALRESLESIRFR